MEIRQAEPYSYCQFIMGRDHNAHGWAYYAATRYMLGIRPGFDRLTVDPCIPAEWDGFDAVRHWRGAVYQIHVENPTHVEKGVRLLEVDGQTAQTIPVFSSGAHSIRVVMG